MFQDKSLTPKHTSKSPSSSTSDCTAKPTKPTEPESTSNRPKHEKSLHYIIQKQHPASADKSLTEANSTKANSLRALILQKPTQTQTTVAKATISPYRVFRERLRKPSGINVKRSEEIDILESDPAVQDYYNYLISRPRSKGKLSQQTRYSMRAALHKFAVFADLEMSNHAITDLITYKQQNPQSNEIERVLTTLAAQQPTKTHNNQASYIKSIFTKGAYLQLKCRFNTHPEPAEENCTEGIFLQIYNAQDHETKDMLQWGQYVPERAKAAYRVPFEDIDLTRSDYAIVWIQMSNSKTATKHPCFVPIDFAKRVIEQAKASGRHCPFPNHESLWKKLTCFAKQEYNVRLVSNYLRKRYVDIAEQTTMPKAQAAFLMGDKTKIALEGIHLDLIYGRGFRFIETLIKNYATSGLSDALTIHKPTQTPSIPQSKEQILTEIQRLQALLDNTR